jgi:hexokinase
MKPFFLSDETVARIRKVFADEMDIGLKYSLEKSSLQMENTFIPELPDGTGKFSLLFVDLEKKKCAYQSTIPIL